jgi:hypothetical protein
MRENNWKMEEALKLVKSKRPCVYPNIGFKTQLKQLEFELGLIEQEQLKIDIDNLIPLTERLNNTNYLKSLEKESE